MGRCARASRSLAGRGSKFAGRAGTLGFACRFQVVRVRASSAGSRVITNLQHRVKQWPCTAMRILLSGSFDSLPRY
jgi:hypothetical protein